jgi:hypothetical protein
MTLRSIGLAAVSILLLSVAPQLHAQASAAASPTRVRLVDVTNGRPLVTGALTGRAGDTLLIMPDSTEGEPQRFSLSSMLRVEHSIGMQRRTMQGFGVGALIGGITGALIAASSSSKQPTCPPDQLICGNFGPSVSASGGAVLLALPGAIIGAIAGYNTQREGWVAADDDRTRLTVAALSRGGLRIGSAVTF